MAENSIKIVPHVFHSLYLFGYFCPPVGPSGPKLLYADWPIVNRIPKAATPQMRETGLKKFESVLDVRKWIESKEDIKEEDYCENFLKIPKDDFLKYRQLFHGLLKHCKIEHKFEASVKVEGKGVGSPTTSVGVSASNPNPTGDDPEGPCVDFVNGIGNKAIIPGQYECSYGIDDDGEVSWGGGRERHSATGPGPCYGAGGGNFSATFKKCDKMRCNAGSWGGPNTCSAGCSYQEPEGLSKEEKEVSLDCCCPPEVWEDGGGDGGNPSTTSSVGLSLIIKKSNENVLNFNERLSFIQNLANVLSTSSGQGKWRDAKGYQCTRSHNKTVKGNIKYDGSLLFKEQKFEKRVGGRQFTARKIKDVEPPKDNPSEEEGAYKEDALEVWYNKVFKKEWEFDNEKFRKIFTDQRRFPSNATIINDPVFEYLKSCWEGKLQSQTYIDIQAGPKKESFLKGGKKINSKNIGEYSFELNSENMSYDFEGDVVTYYLNLNINRTAYIESTREYLIFFDLECKLDLGDIALSWNAGDYPTSIRDDDSGNYIEAVWPNFKNDIIYDDIALFSNKKNFTAEEDKKENGKITKFKIPINFVFESSPEDKEIELFRFEKKESEIKDNPKCVKNKGKAAWNLDELKVQIHGWWQNDFKRGTVFPNPIT